MTYHFNSIMTDDFGTCYVCRRQACDMHHVMHGPDKSLSEEYGLMVPLCRECHNNVHHTGGELDLMLKQDAERALIRYLLGGRCHI